MILITKRFKEYEYSNTYFKAIYIFEIETVCCEHVSWKYTRASLTSRSINDHASLIMNSTIYKSIVVNKPHVFDEMKTKEREKERKAILLSIFLKAFTLRYETYDPQLDSRKLSEYITRHVRRTNRDTRVNVLSLSRSRCFDFAVLSL